MSSLYLFYISLGSESYDSVTSRPIYIIKSISFIESDIICAIRCGLLFAGFGLIVRSMECVRYNNNLYCSPSRVCFHLLNFYSKR